MGRTRLKCVARVLLLLPHATFAQFAPAPTPPFPVAAGHTPVSLATADFNNDSIQDLAVVNQVDGSVGILLGVPSGGFTHAGDVRVGTNPSFIVAAHFDNDPNWDLAVVNQTDGTVTVLKGDGTGKFQMIATLPAGNSPDFVAASDLNGDGLPDLAIVDRGGNTVTVLIAVPGAFSPGNPTPFIPALGSPFAVGTSPGALAIGDFNGDGILDFAVTNELDDNVTVLLGIGGGGFTPATGSPFLVGTAPSYVVAADFNSDGFLDLAVANASSNNVTLLLGNGSGRFVVSPSGPFSTGKQPFAMATGDFNGDNFPDLAVANYSDSTVSVLLGNGAGGFTAGPGSPFAVSGNPRALAVGDFSLHGLPDLAVATTADSIYVLINTTVTTPAMVSAASYQAGTSLALGSLGTIFGTGLSAATASSTTLPFCLGGINVTVTDTTGSKVPMQLSYVSSVQINGLLPAAAALGPATFTVSATAACGVAPNIPAQRGSITIAAAAPALFAANGSGKGAAAGYFIPDLEAANRRRLRSARRMGRRVHPSPSMWGAAILRWRCMGRGNPHRILAFRCHGLDRRADVPRLFRQRRPQLPGVRPRQRCPAAVLSRPQRHRRGDCVLGGRRVEPRDDQPQIAVPRL